MKKFLFLAWIITAIISQMTIANYKSTVEELTSGLSGMTTNALMCATTLESSINTGWECVAEVITVKHAGKECLSLVERATEGFETCMANVEFFKELAAYNESNLDTCLYDLRVERGQRTDGN